MPGAGHPEPEWLTRKLRINTRLIQLGWNVTPFDPARPIRDYQADAVEEYETDTGPADYALIAGGRILGILEAKKLSLGPQNVLVQAQRYSRAASANPLDFRGFRVPFLLSTNGEVIWFHDVRHPLNLSRRIADFPTPDALLEFMGRDLEAACARVTGEAAALEGLRPYQREAVAEVESAIAKRKRRMLVAMVTGTGKTKTAVGLVYRLMKAGVARRILFLVDRRALAAPAEAMARPDAESGAGERAA